MNVNTSKSTAIPPFVLPAYTGQHQREHQSSELLALWEGNHQWPVDSPHKGTVTRKMFPFDDVVIDLVLN